MAKQRPLREEPGGPSEVYLGYESDYDSSTPSVMERYEQRLEEREEGREAEEGGKEAGQQGGATATATTTAQRGTKQASKGSKGGPSTSSRTPEQIWSENYGKLQKKFRKEELPALIAALFTNELVSDEYKNHHIACQVRPTDKEKGVTREDLTDLSFKITKYLAIEENQSDKEIDCLSNFDEVMENSSKVLIFGMMLPANLNTEEYREVVMRGLQKVTETGPIKLQNIKQEKTKGANAVMLKLSMPSYFPAGENERMVRGLFEEFGEIIAFHKGIKEKLLGDFKDDKVVYLMLDLKHQVMPKKTLPWKYSNDGKSSMATVVVDIVYNFKFCSYCRATTHATRKCVIKPGCSKCRDERHCFIQCKKCPLEMTKEEFTNRKIAAFNALPAKSREGFLQRVRRPKSYPFWIQDALSQSRGDRLRKIPLIDNIAIKPSCGEKAVVTSTQGEKEVVELTEEERIINDTMTALIALTEAGSEEQKETGGFSSDSDSDAIMVDAATSLEVNDLSSGEMKALRSEARNYNKELEVEIAEAKADAHNNAGDFSKDEGRNAYTPTSQTKRLKLPAAVNGGTPQVTKSKGGKLNHIFQTNRYDVLRDEEEDGDSMDEDDADFVPSGSEEARDADDVYEQVSLVQPL